VLGEPQFQSFGLALSRVLARDSSLPGDALLAGVRRRIPSTS